MALSMPPRIARPEFGYGKLSTVLYTVNGVNHKPNVFHRLNEEGQRIKPTHVTQKDLCAPYLADENP
jgi:hypothetical protein